MSVKTDVGMQVKMNTKSFAGIEDLDRGVHIDEAPILDLCDFVDARYDCADFRLICLLKTFIDYHSLLANATVLRIESTILSFKYAMDEPGSDGMCFWSENHQLLFAACEYLAGGCFPDRVFDNDKKTGAEHRAKAKSLLMRWMKYRFLYGFNEFHSNTYYEEDVAPLALLADHAEEEVSVRAKIILDLLFLDMAHHSFQGAFVAASGRCYETQKRDSRTADVNDLLHAAFGFGGADYVDDWTRISALFLLCKTYRVPQAIIRIAHDPGPFTVRDSMGLNLSEVKRELPNAAFDDRGLYLWAMEAFTNIASISLTMAMFEAWNLGENTFLRDLAKVNIPILKKLGLLPALVRILNPATQGVAIERANTMTYKTPDYQLSVAQEYHPGFFGDQQHLWQATLPHRVNVFSTHPGSPMFDDPARNFSPSYWVGNGKNPHLAADQNVLLIKYDTRGRKGYLERARQAFVHFHFPEDDFSETIHDGTFHAGRVDQSYIAIRSDVVGTLRDGFDLVFPGRVSHFAVVLGSAAEHGSFAAFVAWVRDGGFCGSTRRFSVSLDRRYELADRNGFFIDGVPVDTDYPRFDTPFVRAPRKPDELIIAAHGERLTLHFDHAVRTEASAEEAFHG
ncbi:MAG: hypothetical protein Q8N15_03690 [Bacillota bacterium]|nr:hypothetical protein [Bacillota bacterium]